MKFINDGTYENIALLYIRFFENQKMESKINSIYSIIKHCVYN